MAAGQPQKQVLPVHLNCSGTPSLPACTDERLAGVVHEDVTFGWAESAWREAVRRGSGAALLGSGRASVLLTIVYSRLAWPVVRFVMFFGANSGSYRRRSRTVEMTT